MTGAFILNAWTGSTWKRSHPNSSTHPTGRCWGTRPPARQLGQRASRAPTLPQSAPAARTLRNCAAPSGAREPARWKDTVALFAQLSPERTVDHLLEGLRRNQTAPMAPNRDEGIEALYAFASFDVWTINNEFFGRKMDLGQFERFKRVLQLEPYVALLQHRSRTVLSALRTSDDAYQCRVQVTSCSGHSCVFAFFLSRQHLARNLPHAATDSNTTEYSWLVDRILYEVDADCE